VHLAVQGEPEVPGQVQAAVGAVPEMAKVPAPAADCPERPGSGFGSASVPACSGGSGHQRNREAKASTPFVIFLYYEPFRKKIHFLRAISQNNHKFMLQSNPVCYNKTYRRHGSYKRKNDVYGTKKNTHCGR
jgi:hypothetical protein